MQRCFFSIHLFDFHIGSVLFIHSGNCLTFSLSSCLEMTHWWGCALWMMLQELCQQIKWWHVDLFLCRSAAVIGRQLAVVGDDINNRYAPEFNQMIRMLHLTPETAYEAFAGVARKYVSLITAVVARWIYKMRLTTTIRLTTHTRHTYTSFMTIFLVLFWICALWTNETFSLSLILSHAMFS